MRRALLSVSDKTGLAAFARRLADRGFELVSTGGTSGVLAAAGLGATAVSDLTRFPEMLDGRVKTLHPAIHAGILARRSRPDDLAALEALGIGLVDLVAVNLYPFVAAASDPSTPFDRLIEEIDIGGPSLVRAAAKNFADVLVVVSPADYDAVIAELDRTDGPSAAFRFMLARKAFAHTAAYDSAIASTLGHVVAGPAGFERSVPVRMDQLPGRLRFELEKHRDLRYGENPHQRAAWYCLDGGAEPPSVVQGKELSFTNLLDLDAAVRVVAEFDEPAAVVVKHTNPCGVATGATAVEAYARAREADPLAAFGGIVGLNRTIDESSAAAIVSTFIEAVIAPGAEEAALKVLAAKKNMRVVLADARYFGAGSRPGSGLDLRTIFGGVLAEEQDGVAEARLSWPPSAAAASETGIRVVTRRQPTQEEWTALRFAWRVAAHVKSNAVIFTASDRTLAIGAGQMSRVDAVKVAVMKTEGGQSEPGGTRSRPLAGSVAASDAFFPFRDGLDAVAGAGATAVVQPGGSVRDAEVIAAADERGLAMVFTGRRHFRH
jgi:phosphoribosylaminoimidazolecarboxamide formyltransferase/IMP cyclohydrolase